VLDQRYDNVEILIVDDGSSSINKHALRDIEVLENDKVNLFELESNHGVSYATNYGFSKSSGDYIALLGDDDYWVDDCKLIDQLETFNLKNVSKLGVVGTWWKELHAIEIFKNKSPGPPTNWKRRLLYGGGIICGSTPLIPRHVWVEVGGLDINMPRGTDSDLFRRIILAGYDAKIIPKYTTVVDVSHGGERMTAFDSLKSLCATKHANVLLIKKYMRYYILYPGAFFYRLKNVISTAIRIWWRY